MDQNQVLFRVEFTIEEGKREDFKKLIQEMARAVQETKPDTTITYQFISTKTMQNALYMKHMQILMPHLFT
jgi:quinol monooxygenase YgiN